MEKFVVVSFGEFDGTVNLIPADDDRLDGARGMCDYEENEIYIADNLSPVVLRRTLIHELTHYALFCYHHSAKDTNKDINFRNEEELCYLNERMLPEIYLQAKFIWKRWTEEESC